MSGGKQKMNESLKPFAIAFVICGLGFLVLDWMLMNAQGLTLFFHG